MIPNALDAMERVPFPLDDVTSRVAIVGCGKEKHSTPWPTPAEQVYAGTYFREVLATCRARYSHVFILSAHYGLIACDTPIKAYDLMLPWSARSTRNSVVIRRFRELCDPPPGWVAVGHKVDLHVGRNYARWFKNHNPDNLTIRWADWGPIGVRRHKYKELR